MSLYSQWQELINTHTSEAELRRFWDGYFKAETEAYKKILSALRIVDFTTSALRQVLPGMTYELPPAQDKEDPITVTPERFAELYAGYPREKSADKFISGSF